MGRSGGALLLLFLTGASAILYPRDSESRNTNSLDGVWNFRISDVANPNEGFDDGWFKKPLSQTGRVIPMAVPASYNDITQEKSIRDFVGWAWYDREFFIPSEWSGKRVVLRFGSVHYNSKVYINGRLVAKHTGGHLPFESEIQDNAFFGKSNRITVAVDNTLTSETIPQGSLKFYNDTKRYPKGFYEYSVNFDFFNYAGIHRSVQLYTTPKTYISDVSVLTNFQDTTGIINFSIKSATSASVSEPMRAAPTCKISLYDKTGQLVVGQSGSCEDSLKVPNVTLWWPFTTNPDPGYLYLMKIQLTSDQTTDVYYQKVGIRTISITEDEFLINKKPFYFTGFGKHEDANIRGKGLDLPIIIKDFNLIKWVGANSFRTSHYPYSEELMDQADEQGIVVIDETPAVGLNKFDDVILSRHLAVVEELITRDKNRPSVVMWSVANEPVGTSAAAENHFKKVVEYTKSIDSSRPITAALNSDVKADRVGQFMDVIMRNRYFAWYSDMGYNQVIYPQMLDLFHTSRAVQKKPTMISEYGADTIPGFHMNPSVSFTEDYQTEFMMNYHEAFDELRKEGGFVGEHIWNFADFMTVQQTTRVVGNKKGIFTRERQPKAAAKILRCRYSRLGNITITDKAVYCPASATKVSN